MRRRSFVQIAGASIGAGLAGCSSSGSSGGEDTVKIGAASSGSTGVLMDVILGEGLDDEHDITIEPTRAGPSEVPQLVVNGGVDVGHLSPVQAAEANHQGNEIRLFGPWLANHTSLLVKPDSPYDTWEDLQGERIGTLPEPTGTYYHTTLRLAHMDIEFEEAYQVEQAGTQTIHSYFQRGDVDAYVFFPPVLIPTLADNEAREIERLSNGFQDIYGDNLHFQNLGAYNDWIQNNEEMAQTVQEIFTEASQMLADDPVSYLQQDYTDTANYESDEHYELAADRTPDIYPGTWEDEDRQNIEDQIADLKDFGQLDEQVPSDVTESL